MTKLRPLAIFNLGFIEKITHNGESNHRRQPAGDVKTEAVKQHDDT